MVCMVRIPTMGASISCRMQGTRTTVRKTTGSVAAPATLIDDVGNDAWVGEAANDELFDETVSGILLRRAA